MSTYAFRELKTIMCKGKSLRETAPTDGRRENRKLHHMQTYYIMNIEIDLGAEVHLHPDGDEEDGRQAEEEDGVDDDGYGAGVEVAKLDDPAFAGDLEEKARREEDEQHQWDEHSSPVLHLVIPPSLFGFSASFSDSWIVSLSVCMQCYIVAIRPSIPRGRRGGGGCRRAVIHADAIPVIQM